VDRAGRAPCRVENAVADDEGSAFPEEEEERVCPHGHCSEVREDYPLPDVRVYWMCRCTFRERLQWGAVSGLQKHEFFRNGVYDG